MPSEVKRGAVRIATNYMRLISNVLIGLVSVQILVKETGNEGWALISMLGVTAGLANLTEDTLRRSMIRELGAALHSKARDEFITVFNTANILALIMALPTLLIFGVILAILPLFNISPSLMSAAYWIVGCKAIESFFDVIFSPTFNTYIASERMFAHNICMIAQRIARLGAAIWLIVAISDSTSTSDALRSYAIVGAVMYIGVSFVAVLVMMLFIEPRTRPRPWLARRSAVGNLVQVGKWNLTLSLSQNLHMKADQIITNLFFGLTYNAIFGWAMQLSSYVRMLGVGVTDGIDAATARISSLQGNDSVRSMLQHSTRVHAFVAVPSAIGFFVLAEPMMRVWIGDRAEDPDTVIPKTALVIQIMVFGNMIRAVSDGWIGVLYGAGHIRRYAKPVAFWSILNPVIAVFLSMNLPETTAYLGPPIAFTVVTLLLSGIVVPIIGARCLELRTRDLFIPLLRPTLVSIVASPLLVIAAYGIQSWNLLNLAGTCALYALAVTLLSIRFVLDRAERARFMAMATNRVGLLRRRIRGGATPVLPVVPEPPAATQSLPESPSST